MGVEFTNLPGIRTFKQDGNLLPEITTLAPTVLVVGTASKGQSEDYVVSTTTLARSAFGTDGTLIRGMYEAKDGGAERLILKRIGGTPAILEGVGDTTGTVGYKIETILKDDSAGTDYAVYYDDGTDRLIVKRNSDDLIVYDNLESSPIDRGEVIVSGYRPVAGGPDIGSPSSFVDLADVVAAGTTFTAGTDGLSLSRMEMYEKLYVAYKELMTTNFDVIIPMDVYLDDLNVVDQGQYLGAVTPVIPVGQSYPTAGAYQPGTDVDSLGKLYVEEYEGEYYFWWDIDGDGTADVYPSTGLADATHGIDGTALTLGDYHEVNFAYQLGRFLYEYSTNVVDATGVIGVRPPNSNSLADKARWVGSAPTWTLNTTTSQYYIATSNDNGKGLLGNKFMVGMSSHRSGVYGGGFIGTDTEWMDGTEETDDNDVAVDLGKYFSIVVDYPLIRNNFNQLGYAATFAGIYGGFYSVLPASSAPTNKVLPGVRVIYKMSLPQLNALTGFGYVTLRTKAQGVVVTDAATAARVDSDWRRLSTVRIVKAVLDGVREAGEPFLGEGSSEASRASMTNAVENVLLGAKRAGFLQNYRPFTIIQTPSMEVEGRAEIPLTLIPSFELRQIDVTASLSKSG